MKLAAAFLTLLAGLTTSTAQTILDIVVASENHMTLEAAVLAAPAAVADALGDSSQGLTLFAPDDTAFSNLAGAVGQDYINDLLTEPYASHLVCLLTSHVLESVVDSTSVMGLASVATLSGYEVEVNSVDGVVTVDGIVVTGPDITASNGVIHSISALPILAPCVSQSIYALGNGTDAFSTLISLVDSANLIEPLSTSRPLTLFAPTNDAFAAVPQYILDYLTSNATALAEVLTYHVAPEIIILDASETDADDYVTLQGDDVILTSADGMVKVNEAEIVDLNVLVSNGVVHVTGSVLIPPTMVLPMDPSITDAPATGAPVSGAPVTTSSPVTEPPVTESPVTVAPVTTAPVPAPIGGTPLLPSAAPVATSLPSIVEIVVASEAHTTLEAAVLAAPSLIFETLGDADQTLTLFAPDDTAFENLISAVGQEYVSALLSEPWAAHLTCLLTSHVLGSVVTSEQIEGTMAVPTLSGYEVTAVGENDMVTIDGVEVTTANIEASNGVIHVLSALPILPPCVSTSIYVLGNTTDDFSTVISLVNKVGLVDALSNTFPLTLFAPTNDAFSKVPGEILNYLLANDTALTEVLLHHVVPMNLLMSSNMTDGSYATLNGDNITISFMDGTSTVKDKPIATTDVLASNGVVQIITDVLIPPTLVLPTVPTAAPTMVPPTEAPSASSTLSAGALACAVMGLLSFAMM